jgi:hypothetical protein
MVAADAETERPDRAPHDPTKIAIRAKTCSHIFEFAMHKLDADEKEILDSVERGEWRRTRAPKRARSRYSGYAKATPHQLEQRARCASG